MSLAPSLILPVEVHSRELDAKLLLACVAAERGRTAILGCAQAIKRSLHALPRGIYVAKGIVKPDLFARVDGLGHRVVAWDEEALVYMTRDTYLRRKVVPEALGRARALFAWGEDNAEAWRDASGYAGQPLFVTGNPRADLLREDLRVYYAPEAAACRKRFGRFILICSNFGYLQHYLPELSLPHADAAAPVPEDKIGTLDDPAMLAHRWQMLQAFKYMIPILAERLPERTIIVRPHPSESAAHWQEVAMDRPNVHVVGGGPVVPWLLAADAVLHNGCTTAVEGFLLGRPTVAYEPIQHPLYDIRLPNDLSHRDADIDALTELLVRADGGAFAPTAAQSALADRFVAARDGTTASERIAVAIDGLVERDGWFGDTRVKPADRVAGMWRNLRRMPRAWLGRDTWSDYLRHRFPDLTPADVDARFRRLKVVTGRFDGVTLRQRGKNIYEATHKRAATRS
jgi:surface carbohydrate biosynthesis protein